MNVYCHGFPHGKLSSTLCCGPPGIFLRDPSKGLGFRDLCKGSTKKGSFRGVWPSAQTGPSLSVPSGFQPPSGVGWIGLGSA